MTLNPYAPQPQSGKSQLEQLLSQVWQNSKQDAANWWDTAKEMYAPAAHIPGVAVNIADAMVDSPFGKMAGDLKPAWEALKMAPWLLNRGQQSVLQGGQTAADWNETTVAKAQNRGVSPGKAHAFGVLPWAIGGAVGAAKGALGLGKDRTGWDQVEGLDIHPAAKWLAGLGLQFTADPFVPIAGGIGNVPGLKQLGARSAILSGEAPVTNTAQMIGKGLWEGLESAGGRWLRTAKNLPSSNDARIAEMNERFGRAGKYDLNVPIPVGADDAMPIQVWGRRPAVESEALINRPLAQPEKHGGAYIRRPEHSGYITYQADAPPKPPPKPGMLQAQETLPHEYQHYIAEMMRRAGLPVDKPLAWLTEKFGPTAKKLRESPSYANKPTHSIGEEIINRWPAKVLEKTGPNALLEQIVSRGQQLASNPALKQAADALQMQKWLTRTHGFEGWDNQ